MMAGRYDLVLLSEVKYNTKVAKPARVLIVARVRMKSLSLTMMHSKGLKEPALVLLLFGIRNIWSQTSDLTL